jgi:K+-sensing histidine kinase KdpD
MRGVNSFYIDIPAVRPGTIGAYAFAFLCAAIAIALRVTIDPYVVGIPFIALFPAVIITTLISGLGAGLVCVALCTAAAAFFLLPPRWSFWVESSADVVDLIFFALEGLFYVILIRGLRVTLERYRELSRNLEQRVEERSAELRESQERLKAVVAELQHRTRNLIRVVGTIAKGTLRSSKTFDDFSGSFQDRLDVLGRAQGLLFHTEAGGRITLDELINTELATQPIAPGERDRSRSTDRKTFLCAPPQSSLSPWPCTS